MSDIRIKTSGDIFFQIDPTLAAILCSTGLAQKYVPPAPEPKKAEWSVGTNNFGDRILIWLKTPAGESVPFNGEPANAEKFYAQNYKNCLPIPPAVIQLYAARRPQPLTYAQQAEIERQQRERTAACAEQNNTARWWYPSNR